MANAYLLKILAKGQKISTRLYEKLMADSSLDSITKKRITMYYKGDKRLAVDKLIAKLKKKTMHGGLGDFKQFTIDNDTKYTIGAKLGSGAFATVYALTLNGAENTEYCVKVFDKQPPQVAEKMVENVRALLQEFGVISGTTLTEYLSSDKNDSWYFMKRMFRDVSFMKKFALYDATIIDKVHTVIQNLSQISSLNSLKLIHGDMKLANILLKSATEKEVAVTDFDSVLTYNTEGTIVVMDMATPHPRTIQHIAVTPLFTHPLYFVWVKFHNDLSSIDSSISAVNIWEKSLISTGVKGAIKDGIIKVLKTYNYEDYIRQASTNKNKFIQALATFDMYSFAISLLYECIVQKQSYECAKVWGEMASENDINLVKNYEMMYNKACNLLEKCFPPSKVQGGRQKKSQKGGSPPALDSLLVKDQEACEAFKQDQNTIIIDIGSLFPTTP
jgi:serine/threonine protein kinase